MSELLQDARASITRSFRFESEVLSVLDEEAKRMGISVNALVGITLRRYSEFTRFLSKIDMVVINREILTAVLEMLDEDDVYKLGAKLGKTVLPDTIIFWKKELTEKSLMEYIDKVVCRYGHLGTYDEKELPSGVKTIVIRHRLGRKGSRFLEGYLLAGLQAAGIHSSFESTDSSVKCDIESAVGK